MEVKIAGNIFYGDFNYHLSSKEVILWRGGVRHHGRVHRLGSQFEGPLCCKYGVKSNKNNRLDIMDFISGIDIELEWF